LPAWFWIREWQQLEREADEDLAAGRVTLLRAKRQRCGAVLVIVLLAVAAPAAVSSPDAPEAAAAKARKLPPPKAWTTGYV
jgi:hypothetical protein